MKKRAVEATSTDQWRDVVRPCKVGLAQCYKIRSTPGNECLDWRGISLKKPLCSACSAPSRRSPGIVIKRWRFVGQPAHKNSNFRVCLQCLPGVELNRQFTLAKRGVDFSMADAVHQGFGFAALAARHQVVFVHARAGLQQPAAQRAISRARRRYKAQGLGAPQGAFGHHRPTPCRRGDPAGCTRRSSQSLRLVAASAATTRRA